MDGNVDETIIINYEENPGNEARTAELIINGENCEPEVVIIYQNSSVEVNEEQEIGILNYRLSNYADEYFLGGN